jgi:hypothetical protein
MVVVPWVVQRLVVDPQPVAREQPELQSAIDATRQAFSLVAVAALAALKPEPVDGWIMTAAFGLQSLFTSRPARLFVAPALLTFAADILLSQRRGLSAAIRAALPQNVRALAQTPAERHRS